MYEKLLKKLQVYIWNRLGGRSELAINKKNKGLPFPSTRILVLPSKDKTSSGSWNPFLLDTRELRFFRFIQIN